MSTGPTGTTGTIGSFTGVFAGQFQLSRSAGGGGSNSIVIGQTLVASSPSGNIIIGDNACFTGSDIQNSTIIGHDSFRNGTQTRDTILIGKGIAPDYTRTSGGMLRTIAIGNGAIASLSTNNTDGSIFMGYNVCSELAGSSIVLANTIVGSQALNNLLGVSSSVSSNTIVGSKVLQNATGFDTSRNLIRNTFVGASVMGNSKFPVTGLSTNDVIENTFVGDESGDANSTTGFVDLQMNTLVGAKSMWSNTNLNNCIGNTFIGQGSCYSNGSLISATNNVGVGRTALISSTNVTGISNSVFLGYNTRATNTVSGFATYRTAIGSDSIVTQDYSTVLGRVNSTNPSLVGIGNTNPNALLQIGNTTNGALTSVDKLTVYSNSGSRLLCVSDSGLLLDSSLPSYSASTLKCYESTSFTGTLQYGTIISTTQSMQAVRVGNFVNLYCSLYYTPSAITESSHFKIVSSAIPERFRPVLPTGSSTGANLFANACTSQVPVYNGGVRGMGLVVYDATGINIYPSNSESSAFSTTTAGQSFGFAPFNLTYRASIDS
jgi:hypothetical protein